MPNLFSDDIAIVATIDPTGAATGTVTSDVIDMKNWDEVTFVVMTGTVLSTGTVDFTVFSGVVSGTVTTSVTDITQLTETDDNKQVIVTVDAASLSGRYVKGVLKAGTANSACAVAAFGRRARYKPAYGSDLASVDEIINA